MTVNELIEKLSKEDPNASVCIVPDYDEDGCTYTVDKVYGRESDEQKKIIEEFRDDEIFLGIPEELHAKGIENDVYLKIKA